MIVKTDFDSIKGNQNLLIEKCQTKNLLKFNVEFCLKILRPVYKNSETMHFTTDFVSNLFLVQLSKALRVEFFFKV